MKSFYSRREMFIGPVFPNLIYRGHTYMLVLFFPIKRGGGGGGGGDSCVGTRQVLMHEKKNMFNPCILTMASNIHYARTLLVT